MRDRACGNGGMVRPVLGGNPFSSVGEATLDIILIAGAKSRPRTLTIHWRHWTGGAFALAVLVLAVTFTSQHLRVLLVSALARSGLPPIVSDHDPARQDERDLQQGKVNAMAVRIGELQAKLLTLDGLGARLAEIAGLKAQEFPSRQPGGSPGRGGADSTLPSRELSVGELTSSLDSLTRELDRRSDQFGVLETMLLQDSVRRQFLPTLAPVIDGWFSSNFGYRIDPFTGMQSFHEGIDF